MSLLWRTAKSLFDPEPHVEHAMHPWLAEAGFGHSPCTDVTCPEFDEDQDKALDRAYAIRGTVETHEPGSVHLHGMEHTIDPGTVARYVNNPPSKAPPRVFTYRGQQHILDGHHRLLADTIAGRPLTYEHTNLDES